MNASASNEARDKLAMVRIYRRQIDDLVATRDDVVKQRDALVVALRDSVEYMEQYEQQDMDEWTRDILTAARAALAQVTP